MTKIGTVQRRSAIQYAVPLGLLISIAGWLFASAFLVDIEYYDGYSAICNARFLLGLHEQYIGDRMPMMSILLLPAEWWKSSAGMHPLEVRPDHLTLAVLHTVYLVSVYFALVRFFGATSSTLLAYLAAVMNFMFFSYAPFLSHDLLPGAALLWMLILSRDYLVSPNMRIWLSLVALGTFAALLKQTYAIFWMIVLLVHAAPIIAGTQAERKRFLSALLQLAAAALVSGVITWIVLGYVFTTCAPQVPLLARPLVHLRYVANVHAGKNLSFPIWMYLWNFPAYGWLVTGLLVPGLIMARRGSKMQRTIAAGWLLGFCAMHIVHLREVRYIAFLAPLSAFIIAPVVQAVLKSKYLVALALAAMIGDAARIIPEAARITSGFYRDSPIKQFLEPLGKPGALRKPVVSNTTMFSFVAPGRTPLAADRYHRVFNFGLHHLALLYGYEPADVVLAPSSKFPAAVANLPERSVVLYSSTILARGPSPRPGAPPGMESFLQFSATPEILELNRSNAGSYINSAGQSLVIEAVPDGHNKVLLSGPVLATFWNDCPLGMLTLPEKSTAYLLRPARESSCEIITATDSAELAAELIEEEHLVLRRFVRQQSLKE